MPATQTTQAIPPELRDRTHKLTLLAFLATAAMLFAAFMAAYLIRRTATDWKPIALPGVLWANTAVLLASSATVELARRTRVRAWLVLTLLLGFLFLGGQAAACAVLAARGIYLSSHPHSSFLYMLAVVHAAHLIGGLAWLSYALVRRSSAELGALYWHFVDGVWLYLLVVLRWL